MVTVLNGPVWHGGIFQRRSLHIISAVVAPVISGLVDGGTVGDALSANIDQPTNYSSSATEDPVTVVVAITVNGVSGTTATTVEAGDAVEVTVTVTDSAANTRVWTRNATAAATVPAQFGTGHWSMSFDGATMTLTVGTLPDDGGAALSDLEYRVDGGAAVSLGAATTGDYTITATTGQTVNLRAVNAVGGGAWSADKAAPAQPPVEGGTVSDVTDPNDGLAYRVHAFTAGGTLTVNAETDVEYLVVAGGGGGGGPLGAGAGAGGLLTNVGGTKLTLSVGSYPIVVGAGGAGGTTADGSQGSNSTALGLTAIGGGYGARNTGSGGAGGSGGGRGMNGAAVGSGTAGQGNDGADRGVGGRSGGGGGAGGTPAVPTATGGAGGVGVQNIITGANVYYAGGGGGCSNVASEAGGAGGNGGGGAGVDYGLSVPGGNGLANTGGGGGAAWASGVSGGSGGSGIVVVRYRI